MKLKLNNVVCTSPPVYIIKNVCLTFVLFILYCTVCIEGMKKADTEEQKFDHARKIMPEGICKVDYITIL